MSRHLPRHLTTHGCELAETVGLPVGDGVATPKLIGVSKAMWIVLMTMVGVCLVLSMFDRPPANVPVPLCRRGGGDAVPSARIDDPEADGRGSGLGGGTR